jgi:hypothetical protein
MCYQNIMIQNNEIFQQEYTNHIQNINTIKRDVCIIHRLTFIALLIIYVFKDAIT